MNDELSETIGAAIKVASYWLRQSEGTAKPLDAFAKEQAESLRLPDEALPSIIHIADALLGFASAVRAAERMNKPILSEAREPSPPRRKSFWENEKIDE